MPDPYPNELRRRIIERIETGASVFSVAKRFRVSDHYASKVWDVYRKTGSIDRLPQLRHGPVGSVTESLKKKIVLTMQNRPQTQISEIRTMLQDHGVRLGYSRVHQILEMLGCTGAKRKAMLAAWKANSTGKKAVGEKARSRPRGNSKAMKP